MQGHAGPTDISDGIGRKTTTVSGRLANMKADGYVEYYRQSRGRYTITAEGQNYLQEQTPEELVGDDMIEFERVLVRLISESDYYAVWGSLDESWRPWDGDKL